MYKGTMDEKLDLAFKAYDLDGNGVIDKEELFQILKARWVKRDMMSGSWAGKTRQHIYVLVPIYHWKLNQTNNHVWRWDWIGACSSYSTCLLSVLWLKASTSPINMCERKLAAHLLRCLSAYVLWCDVSVMWRDLIWSSWCHLCLL